MFLRLGLQILAEWPALGTLRVRASARREEEASIEDASRCANEVFQVTSTLARQGFLQPPLLIGHNKTTLVLNQPLLRHDAVTERHRRGRRATPLLAYSNYLGKW